MVKEVIKSFETQKLTRSFLQIYKSAVTLVIS
jgi:hypothetical protein